MSTSKDSMMEQQTEETTRGLTGARAVARALVDNGVTDLFGVHGYINPVLEEACQLGVRMWHFRHEQAAGFAADAYARTIRKPGVFFASASAGMANCLSSLSQGIGARSPMVLLVGQHGTAGDGLETLQEGYAAEAFKTVAKWTHRCTDPELNAYWMRKALVDAVSYPPGPVVLEFPLNNQWTPAPVPQLKYRETGGLPELPQTQGDPARVDRVAELLRAAERPVLIAGDGVHWSDGASEYQRLAELLQAPAGARRTARGAMPEDHPLAFTSGYRKPLFEQADLICVVGLQAGELDSWFEAPEWPQDVTYVQIQETQQDVWYAMPSSEIVVGSSRLVLRQLIDRLEGDGQRERDAWTEVLDGARTRHCERRQQLAEKYADRTPIHTYELAQAIGETVAPDATIIYDSYQGSLYLTDAIKARFSGQVLDAGPRVALGQGVGMAFGAAVARPGAQVLTLVGDGGIGLAGMDLETLARYEIPAVVVILNNSSWGGGSLVQEDIQPGMASWGITEDTHYDQVFAPLGCHTERVTSADQLRPALERALASGRTAVVDVVADTDGPAVSVPWLRLKTGEFYSRGIDDLPASVLKHFHAVSPIEALRLHKMARDNGTRIPVSFLAQLTGHDEQQLVEAAERSGYPLSPVGEPAGAPS
ncbi:MAG: thiamine pyrophosphate-binding protein [Actinobacteria bacterium]|nr:thiamine pyrophosphate-binding protein [Actinomycetota bacterium]